MNRSEVERAGFHAETIRENNEEMFNYLNRAEMRDREKNAKILPGETRKTTIEKKKSFLIFKSNLNSTLTNPEVEIILPKLFSNDYY